MNKLLVLVLSSMIMVATASGQPGSDAIIGKAGRLKKLYHAASLHNVIPKANERTAQDFFYEFPDNFSTFVALYGFSNNKPHILYHQAENHIALFNLVHLPDDTLYYRKLVNLSLYGRWDADAVSYLQQCLISHVQENSDLVMWLLAGKSEEEILSFWIFYFDGPHPANTPQKLLSFSARYPEKMQKVIRAAYDLVVKDWGNE